VRTLIKRERRRFTGEFGVTVIKYLFTAQYVGLRRAM
jgi:hypothetical protein